MEPLNYHHLQYFWQVAKAGTIAQACEQLNLSQPTISTQLKKLEQALGKRLFRKSGRRLELTDVGRQVFRYADEIFAIGQDLVDTVQGRPPGSLQTFSVGISAELSPAVAVRLLRPVLHLAEPVRLQCRRGELRLLLGELAMGRIDMILGETAVGPEESVRAYSHLAGETGISFLTIAALSQRYVSGFPRSLGESPVLLPAQGQSLRSLLDRWFAGIPLRPRVVAEFDDSADMYEMGRAGLGAFPVPTVVEQELQQQLGAQVCGRLDQPRQSLFITTLEPQPQHPGTRAILEEARRELTPVSELGRGSG